MRCQRVAIVLGVATLTLLAGCVGSIAPDAGEPIDGGDDPGRTTAATGTETSTGTVATDPYGGRTLVVAVENPTNGTRDYAPLVGRALDYWEANASGYVAFDVSYRLDPDATDPDVVVTVVDRIEECGSEHDQPAGCAPYITRPSQFTPPERVRVVGGLTDESVVRVLIHEFGHTLGLDHDDEPRAVMRAENRLATLPQRDAVDRSFAWPNRTLSVHVDVQDDAGDRADVERRVEGTLAYFDRGAAGTVPEGVSFVRRSDRSAADVVIQVGGDHPCDRDSGSCRRLRGLDPDGDDRLETYDRLEVYVVGLEPEAVGWHVGRHLGHALGLTDDAAYPEPLRTSATYDERRSDWWAASNASAATTTPTG